MTSRLTLDSIRIRIGINLFLALLIAGCTNGNELADAYGNFEATETTISSESSGRLLSLTANEGDYLDVGTIVGLVDTTQLSLKRRQLVAGRQSILSRTRSVRAQIDVLEEQRRVATIEQSRIERLLADGAATTKQLDDIQGQMRILVAQEQQIRTQNATILSELETLDAQVAQLDDQLARSVIVNPVDGIVLAKYAEAYEITAPGRPLYKIADLSSLVLRAYVSGAQLPNIQIGQQVEVQIDETESSNHKLQGTITWVASEAEFTPKLIQTKEERVNLVYAVKVRVENPDGIIKIGMPGEVWLRAEATSAN